jgi:hypothetical protein
VGLPVVMMMVSPAPGTLLGLQFEMLFHLWLSTESNPVHVQVPADTPDAASIQMSAIRHPPLTNPAKGQR